MHQLTQQTSRRRALATGAGLVAMAASACAHKGELPAKRKAVLAPTPPMGWNSWNSFATTITQDQALENAAIMARELLPFGYDVFTIDIQWYEPGATSYNYRDGAELTMDAHGRLLPAPNRFPSAVDGVGFKALARQVHQMGLKFGIHVMRGIPRQAVARNSQVLGTNLGARDIADTSSVCTWNRDMYGVDMTRPGAQAYYDSIFALYASWDVDFIKMDDMSRPYGANWREIEAAHHAINRSGRPMILSLSPGETDLKWAEHVGRYAQMWRISDDFWDEWKLLRDQFQRLEDWNPWRAPGAWPDADMLPLGRLALGKRDSKFTPDEQRTLMSLWAIARSPLIMGGDLRHLDANTLSLLTNRDVLAINQASHENRPLPMPAGQRAWVARSQQRADLAYLALFNTADAPADVSVNLAQAGWTKSSCQARDIWEPNGAKRAETATITRSLAPHACALLELS